MEQMKKSYSGKKVSDMEIVMVSKQLQEVKDYIHAQVRKGYSK
jgi:hypothetical protein